MGRKKDCFEKANPSLDGGAKPWICIEAYQAQTARLPKVLLGSFFIHHFEENNMVKKIKVLGKATFLALSLAAMIVGAALAVDSVTLLNYQIDFLGFEQTGDTSTWRYAVCQRR